MILNKRYNKIMNKIEVSPEMRNRILENISNLDFANVSDVKTGFLLTRHKYLPLIACLVILLTGLFIFPITPYMAGPLSVLQNSIVESSSLQELIDTVGFDIEDIAAVLPFTPQETQYTSYGTEMAEIKFIGEEQTAVYRKSLGQEDNSGDYNAYDNVWEVKFAEYSVTLKGSADSYVLACWIKADYSYSLSLSSGLSVEAWQELLSNIRQCDMAKTQTKQTIKAA